MYYKRKNNYNKFEKLDDKFEKVIKEVEMDDKTKEKMKAQVKNEFEEYKKDVLKDDIKLYDSKPFIQKIIFVIVGLFFWPVGYALYFLTKDDKNNKWMSKYLVDSSTIGLAITILGAIGSIISTIIEKTAA